MDPFFNLINTFFDTFVDNVNAQPLQTYLQNGQQNDTPNARPAPPTIEERRRRHLRALTGLQMQPPDVQEMYSNPFHGSNPFLQHILHNAYMRSNPILTNSMFPMTSYEAVSSLLTTTMMDIMNTEDVWGHREMEDVKVTLDKDLFHLLPVVKTSTSKECSICMEQYSEGEDRTLLPCKHDFHPRCIHEWLCHHAVSCPVCRADVRDQIEKVKTD
jgi:hypothetical protein